MINGLQENDFFFLLSLERELYDFAAECFPAEKDSGSI